MKRIELGYGERKTEVDRIIQEIMAELMPKIEEFKKILESDKKLDNYQKHYLMNAYLLKLNREDKRDKVIIPKCKGESDDTIDDMVIERRRVFFSKNVWNIGCDFYYPIL